MEGYEWVSDLSKGPGTPPTDCLDLKSEASLCYVRRRIAAAITGTRDEKRRVALPAPCGQPCRA